MNTLSVRVTPEQHETLRQAAKQQKVSLNTFCVEAVLSAAMNQNLQRTRYFLAYLVRLRAELQKQPMDFEEIHRILGQLLEDLSKEGL